MQFFKYVFIFFRLKLCEVKDDIFGLPSTFSLAHCVSSDFDNSMGITANFKYANLSIFLLFFFI